MGRWVFHRLIASKPNKESHGNGEARNKRRSWIERPHKSERKGPPAWSMPMRMSEMTDECCHCRIGKRSNAGERVLADEEITGAEGGGALRRRTARREAREANHGRCNARVPAAVQAGNRQVVGAAEFLGSCGEVGVLNVAVPAEVRRHQRWIFGQGIGIRRRIKAVEKICQAAFEGIAVQCEKRDFRKRFRSHNLPSSKRPSTRYCVFTGMRLTG